LATKSANSASLAAIPAPTWRSLSGCRVPTHRDASGRAPKRIPRSGRLFPPPGFGCGSAAPYYTSSNSSQVDKIRRHRGSLIFCCGSAALRGRQFCPNAFRRPLRARNAPSLSSNGPHGAPHDFDHKNPGSQVALLSSTCRTILPAWCSPSCYFWNRVRSCAPRNLPSFAGQQALIAVVLILLGGS
jgi:hypothetical protein